MILFVCIIIAFAAIVFVAALISGHLEETRVINSIEKSDRERYELQRSANDKYNHIQQFLGAPTLIYSEYCAQISQCGKSNYIYASLFEKEKKLWLFDKLISFDDIDDVYIEEQRFIACKKRYDEGSLQTGKLFKRAAVGGLLFGVTGAALGAVTTSKDKRCIAIDKTISFDYDLIIVIKNGGNVKLKFFDNISPELDSWVDKLEKLTGIRPRVNQLDDIDMDLINEYKI